MTQANVLHEADLHAFVDGLLESERRPELLRRLAESPSDRARIESWQEQNDLIRAAFAGVVREPLPAALDLAPPFKPTAGIEAIVASPGSNARRTGRLAATVATALLVAACVGATWMMSDADDKAQPDTADASLRGTIDATLATRASQALTSDVRARSVGAASLPAAAIPDLSGAGFALTRADTEGVQPVALVLHYQNADADKLVLSVARAPGGGTATPTRVGRSYSWRRQDKAFALAGTVRTDRLLAIALSLQTDAEDN